MFGWRLLKHGGGDIFPTSALPLGPSLEENNHTKKRCLLWFGEFFFAVPCNKEHNTNGRTYPASTPPHPPPALRGPLPLPVVLEKKPESTAAVVASDILQLMFCPKQPTHKISSSSLPMQVRSHTLTIRSPSPSRYSSVLEQLSSDVVVPAYSYQSINQSINPHIIHQNLSINQSGFFSLYAKNISSDFHTPTRVAVTEEKIVLANHSQPNNP